MYRNSMNTGSNALFDEFNLLERELNDLFGGWTRPASIRQSTRQGYPPINVGVTPKHVDVYLFAAGLDVDALDLSLHQNLLTIAGKRSTPEEENVRYHARERFSGEFRRAVSLPEDVDPDKVQATYRNGVLHIQIQRQNAAGPRKIEIK